MSQIYSFKSKLLRRRYKSFIKESKKIKTMIFTIKKFPDVNSSLKRNAILIIKKTTFTFACWCDRLPYSILISVRFLRVTTREYVTTVTLSTARCIFVAQNKSILYSDVGVTHTATTEEDVKTYCNSDSSKKMYRRQ